MKNLFCVFVGLFILIATNAQSFNASSVPDVLKSNANVVIRLEEKTLEIKSPEKASIHRHLVCTILNEKGDDYADFIIVYDKFKNIGSVSGYLYDANGKELKHFKKKDMLDHPYNDGSSFVNDVRYKRGTLSWHSYPYTVVFDEEEDINGFIGIEGWNPQPSIESSVERSVYTITAPSDYNVRFKLLNAKIDPQISEKNNRKTYSWEIRNLPAFEEIPFSAPWIRYSPYLMVGASEIEQEGYKGNMTTWTGFAKFYADLQKGRDLLPDEVKRKVHELTDAISDKRKKVAVLYDYLQKNTHYVGFQLGIGGWQTFDATYVAHNKYGDCKALSNFMVALLKEAGIKGHPVIIHGGTETRDFVKDFTNDPFNHIICCVPLGKDSIWLECTDQYLPAGYLSSFTANRYGLLVDDDGGTLVHTPAYLLPDNKQIRKITASLSGDGKLTIDSKTSYRAACQDEIEGIIHHYSKEEQQRWLKGKFDLPTYDVTLFNYEEDYSNRLPVIRESLQIAVTDYAQVSGKRIFLNPDVLTRTTVKLTADDHRIFDIDFKDEYCHVDSIQIAVPAGYEPESIPEDLMLQSKFGAYETHLKIDGEKIVYYRKFERYRGRFPGSDYSEVVKFYDEIYKSDHGKIVLVKKS